MRRTVSFGCCVNAKLDARDAHAQQDFWRQDGIRLRINICSEQHPAELWARAGDGTV